MAGRGTDILLGGNPGFMAKLRVREAVASSAGVPIPPVKDGFYPCDLSDEATGILTEAAAVFAPSVKGAEDEAAAITRIDEALAVAASAAEIDEDSVPPITGPRLR